MIPDEERRYREKLEVLDGSRARQKRQAAVRIADVAPLLQIPDRLRAQPAAGSTPTAAEYATLLADVEFLRARLFEISQILTGKLVP